MDRRSCPSRQAPARLSPTAFGRYAVRRSLGAGGFGEVYLGHDTVLDRPVAIKMLRPGSTPLLGEGDPALQEARTLAHLRHPGIVAIHDVGVHAGQMYVVSDYLDGPDLGRWLRDNRPAVAGGCTDRRRRGRCAESRPRAAHRPPRRQTGEHHRHGRSRARAGGLRSRLGRGAGGGWRERSRLWDAVVHVTRTGGGHGASHRWPHRRVQPGRGPLRNAHGPRAVPGHDHRRADTAGARG